MTTMTGGLGTSAAGSAHVPAAGDRIVAGPPLDPRIQELTGETLVELLERSVGRTPGATSMVIRRGLADERWTYQQLLARSERVAQTLRRHGATSGSRIVTWSPNDPWLVAAYFAAWRLGAIVVPLDLRMQEDVAVRIGRRTEPVLVLAGTGVPTQAAGALGAPVLEVSGASLDPDEGVGSEAKPLPPVGPAAVAEVLFTSGTTSDPKGVVLTHGQMIHNARVIAQTGMGDRPDRALAIIPLSHMYGQIVPLFLALISGSTLVFLHALTPSAIAATTRRERITVLTLVPQLMRILLDGIESEAARRGRLESLQRTRAMARYLPFPARRILFRSVLRPLGGQLAVITSGGAHLPPELQASWEAMGILVVQGYGATECAAIAGHSRRERCPGTAGAPLAGLEVRIAPDGELLAHGPNVMDGYWNDPAATAEVMAGDGWVRTGDAARIDEHGQVVILGRTRDRIALPNGLKVYPEDVEMALREAGVAAAVVLEATPGRLVAVLVPADRGADDRRLDDAVRRANATLAPHQRVRSWRRWPDDDFPRTHTLKIRREAVKAWFREHEEAPASAASLADAAASSSGRSRRRPAEDRPDDLSAPLCSVVADVAAELHGGPRPAVTPTTPLESLDFDSLGRVTLALRIEEVFDAPLPDEEIAEALDVADLARRIAARDGTAPAPEPSRWAFSGPARLVRKALDATWTGWLVDLVATPEAVGLEHLATLDGPVLICPNHTSHLDAPSVRRVLPASMRDRTAIAAAADYFFSGSPLGPIVALGTGAFPFGRTSDVRASLERVADFVGNGWNVLLFPEGTRSPDGRLGPMREGIGLLATRLGVPVLPVHISGAYEILPKGRFLPRRRRTSRVLVRFGERLFVPPNASIHEATRAVDEAIRSLGDGAPGITRPSQ